MTATKDKPAEESSDQRLTFIVRPEDWTARSARFWAGVRELEERYWSPTRRAA
jgi:hypothetical protein